MRAKGFTLIEIIIFVAIVAILIGLLMPPNSTGSNPTSPQNPTPTPTIPPSIEACSGKQPGSLCTYFIPGAQIMGKCVLQPDNTDICLQL